MLILLAVVHFVLFSFLDSVFLPSILAGTSFFALTETSCLQSDYPMRLYAPKGVMQWNYPKRKIVIQSRTNVHSLEFALKLYKAISHGVEDKNIFFSSFNVRIMLGLLYIGAKGRTRIELSNGALLPNDNNKLSYMQEKFFKVINEKNVGHILTVANRLYFRPETQIGRQFQSLVESKFQTSVERINFGETDLVVKDANVWVSNTTMGKITSILSQEDVDADSLLLLLGAVYFSGNWSNKFDEKKTRPAPFYVDESKTVQVDMMSLKNKFKYAQNEAAKMLELQYKGNRISMIILLPHKKNGFAAIENALNLEFIMGLKKRLRPKTVEIKIPKFTIDQTIKLPSILSELGIKEIFSDHAELSGISKDNHIHVDSFMQKAYIEVNEKGSEASALAVASTHGRSIFEAKPTFIADHPFIFIIQHRVTGSVLFMGALKEPDSQSHHH